jgi:hypothetical protein
VLIEGDLIGLLGDALICSFSPRDGSSGQAECAARVLQCALALKSICTPALSAHIGVSSGLLHLGVLGGHKDEWCYLLSGECLKDLSVCLDDADNKELVVTAKCYELMRASLPRGGTIQSARVEATGNYRVEVVLGQGTVAAGDSQRNRLTAFSAEDEFLQLAKRFVPPPALNAIFTGSFGSIAALRQVTTMFLKLDVYTHERFSDPVSLQPFFLTVQEELAACGGFMRQFLVDDKGCVVIGMWGVPAYTYENSAHRAINCATSVSSKLKALDLDCSIGITTGDVYCGNVGSQLRRDFVGIGAKVNMAARLMGKAQGRVLVDEQTFCLLPRRQQGALTRLDVGLELKGFNEKVFPYLASSLGMQAAVEVAGDRFSEIPLELRQLMTEQLDSISLLGTRASQDGFKSVSWSAEELVTPEDVQCLVVRGTAGMGMENVAALYKRLARDKCLRCVFVSAKAGDEDLEFEIARRIFLGLLVDKSYGSTTGQLEYILSLLLRAMPHLDETRVEQCVFRLGRVLGTDLEAVDVSRVIENVWKQQTLTSCESEIDSVVVEDVCFQRVLLTLLRERHTVVVVEEAQFVDASSMRELEQLIELRVPCCLLLTLRLRDVVTLPRLASSSNLPPVLSAEANRDSFYSIKHRSSLLSQDAAHRDLFDSTSSHFSWTNCIKFDLPKLSREVVQGRLLVELQLDEVPDQIVDLVLNVSTGIPYWCNMLVEYISDRGLERVLQEVGVEGGGGDFLKAVFLLRFEGLEPTSQSVARYACVVGESFDRDTLVGVLPGQLVETLDDSLAALLELKYIRCVDVDEQAYLFGNVLTANYLYALIPPSELSRIHGVVGGFFLNREREVDTHGYQRVLKHFTRCRGRAFEVSMYMVLEIEHRFEHNEVAAGVTQIRRLLRISRKHRRRRDLEEAQALIEDLMLRVSPVLHKSFKMAPGMSIRNKIASFVSSAIDSANHKKMLLLQGVLREVEASIKIDEAYSNDEHSPSVSKIGIDSQPSVVRNRRGVESSEYEDDAVILYKNNECDPEVPQSGLLYTMVKSVKGTFIPTSMSTVNIETVPVITNTLIKPTPHAVVMTSPIAVLRNNLVSSMCNVC